MPEGTTSRPARGPRGAAWPPSAAATPIPSLTWPAPSRPSRRTHEGGVPRRAPDRLLVPSGRSGSYARLTGEVARIFAAGYAETWLELRSAPASARASRRASSGAALAAHPALHARGPRARAALSAPATSARSRRRSAGRPALRTASRLPAASLGRPLERPRPCSPPTTGCSGRILAWRPRAGCGSGCGPPPASATDGLARGPAPLWLRREAAAPGPRRGFSVGGDGQRAPLRQARDPGAAALREGESPPASMSTPSPGSPPTASLPLGPRPHASRSAASSPSRFPPPRSCPRLASSVAASRVVLGLHWLSDVLAGALMGLPIGTRLAGRSSRVAFDNVCRHDLRSSHGKRRSSRTASTPSSKGPPLPSSYEQALLALAAKREDLVVMAAKSPTPLRGLSAALGARFIDVGLCDETLVGAAAGLALRGRTPVVHASASLLAQRAFEFVRAEAGPVRLPVTLVGFTCRTRSPRRAGPPVGSRDLALMRAIPEMQVFCPADREELLEALPVIVASGRPGLRALHGRRARRGASRALRDRPRRGDRQRGRSLDPERRGLAARGGGLPPHARRARRAGAAREPAQPGARRRGRARRGGAPGRAGGDGRRLAVRMAGSTRSWPRLASSTGSRRACFGSGPHPPAARVWRSASSKRSATPEPD